MLEAEIEGEIAGDPMGDKKWVRRSLRKLQRALRKQGYYLGKGTIRRLLKVLGYLLQANRKRLTGPPHPDRDRQFRYIERVKKLFLAAGHPVY